jgi:hypothetical protein
VVNGEKAYSPERFFWLSLLSIEAIKEWWLSLAKELIPAVNK